MTLWFDTHSQYYPFNGELLPLADLDHDIHQQYWLPLFAGLTWIYTLLGVIGGGWCSGGLARMTARRWLFLALLLTFLRLGFFARWKTPSRATRSRSFPFFDPGRDRCRANQLQNLSAFLRQKLPT